MVYLIHLERKFKHAQHYIGYTSGPMYQRLARHRSGNGSAMLRAVNKEGIAYVVARKWMGDRNLERKLKKQTRSRELCPICNPKLKTRYKYYVITNNNKK